MARQAHQRVHQYPTKLGAGQMMPLGKPSSDAFVRRSKVSPYPIAMCASRLY